MAGSLQDQLLKAGLADARAAKELQKEKRKQARVARKTGAEVVDENREAARLAREEKARRDRELNQEIQDRSQRKAINAQIRQLIETSRLRRDGADVGFNFTDGSKIKKLYVTALQQRQLSAGVLAIAKQGDQYEIVPHVVAEKIAQRDAARVIFPEQSGDVTLTEEEQDWYKDYEIPDDLMW
jgi:uncharacterized protein YaiL (DUF2058 family)